MTTSMGSGIIFLVILTVCFFFKRLSLCVVSFYIDIFSNDEQFDEQFNQKYSFFKQENRCWLFNLILFKKYLYKAPKASVASFTHPP